MFESRVTSSRNPTGQILRVGLFVAVAMTAACGGAATGSGSGSTVLDKDNSDAHRDAMVGLAKKALAKL